MKITIAMKTILILFFSYYCLVNVACQPNQNEKIIDDFVKASHNNRSFSNGINVSIDKPKNDKDALERGFIIAYTDQEEKGEWKILAAKDVIIEQQGYWAVLYEYKNHKYIVLYKEEKDGKYYFRIFSI